MVAQKINVKENVNDGEIDLSMMNLQEVPVKEISVVKKAHGLDLSNNRLVTLPKNFPTLVNLIRIDLSRNELQELPENFGDLVKLKHLDLYKNKLQHLPLSFSKLTSLKWLDLKDNNLLPSIAEVAGHCLDAQQCHKCAKDIVALYSKLQIKVDEEIQFREEQRQKSLAERASKLKQEKKTKKTKVAKKESNKGVEETKTSDVHPSTTNRVLKTKIKVHKESYISSVSSFVVKALKLFLILLSIPVLVLIMLRVTYGTTLEDKLHQLLSNIQLPLEINNLIIIVVEYVFVLHDALCNEVVQFRDNHSVKVVWRAFTEVYQNVTQASNKVYLQIFGK